MRSSAGSRGAPLTRGAAILLLLLTFLAVSCSRTARLENSFESDETLARAVLDGLERQDRDGLVQLAVTKDEFKNLVWPTLRASRPEVGMPVDYVWQDTLTKSNEHLTLTLSRYGGKRYALVRVGSSGETTEQRTHEISRKTQLVVRDAEGREQTVRLFGSIIRQGGRSKVFSYIVD